jgi:hypothetical protein
MSSQVLRSSWRGRITLATVGLLGLILSGSLAVVRARAEESTRGMIYQYLNETQWLCYGRCLQAPCCWILP